MCVAMYFQIPREGGHLNRKGGGGGGKCLFNPAELHVHVYTWLPVPTMCRLALHVVADVQFIFVV